MSCTSLPKADSPPQIAAFKSDGCTLFPDGTIMNNNLWQKCCIKHDFLYWRGGSKEDKKTADGELRNCIIKKTGSIVLAEIMYLGVKICGSAFFPTWYRWGYGWPYGRGYNLLIEEEEKLISERRHDYCQQEPSSIICDN